MAALIRFVTLFSANIDVAVNFYRCLGLEFVQEKHGNGPLHYSHAGPSITIEIYPLNAPPEDERGVSEVMLGIETTSLENASVAVTENGGSILEGVAAADLGRRFVAQDPDGRRVYVYGPS